jgi:hypothetical protein
MKLRLKFKKHEDSMRQSLSLPVPGEQVIVIKVNRFQEACFNGLSTNRMWFLLWMNILLPVMLFSHMCNVKVRDGIRNVQLSILCSCSIRSNGICRWRLAVKYWAVLMCLSLIEYHTWLLICFSCRVMTKCVACWVFSLSWVKSWKH